MKDKISISIVMILCVILAGALAYVGAIAGNQYGNKFYFIMAFALIPLYGAWLGYKRLKLIDYINVLNDSWGRPVKRKRNIENIKKWFEQTSKEDTETFFIDNQTWDDFNMDTVYEKLDRTVTTPGEEELYTLLRKPLFEKDALDERKKIITLLKRDADTRKKLQLVLGELGRDPSGNVGMLLSNKIDTNVKYRVLYNVMAVIAILAFVSLPFQGPAALVSYVIPIYFANTFIHYKAKQDIGPSMEAISYLNRILSASYALKDKKYNLDKYSEEIERLYKECKPLYKSVGKLTFKTGNELNDAISSILLSDERHYCSAIKNIKKYQKQLRKIYAVIGEMDALLSIASYRKDATKYCEPELIDGASYIKIVNGIHPLIDDAVENSIDIDGKGVLITGSNMSGKSTFLRVVGINALFAQTICTCLADSYRAGYFKIVTSISRTDNVIGGKSYYLAEAESLLRIINSVGGKYPVLSIIDEIFRGTNSVERINASAEILKAMVNKDVVNIAATHDLELAPMIESCYDFYHFSEDVDDNGLKFDYKIKDGISETRNAVRIMEYIGYPKDMIQRIRERIAKSGR